MKLNHYGTFINSHHLNHFTLVKNYVNMRSLCNHHVSVLVEIIHLYKKKVLILMLLPDKYKKTCMYVNSFIGSYVVSKLVALK